jgi:hypothetical protein
MNLKAIERPSHVKKEMKNWYLVGSPFTDGWSCSGDFIYLEYGTQLDFGHAAVYASIPHPSPELQSRKGEIVAILSSDWHSPLPNKKIEFETKKYNNGHLKQELAPYLDRFGEIV